MRALLSKIFSTQGLRGPVLTLLTGSTLGLIISLLAQLVLARLYTEAEFGVYGYFASIMAVLITFTGLRYEDALMLQEEERDAGVVVLLGFLVVTFFAAVTAVLALWRTKIATLLEMPAMAPYLVLVPVTLIAMRGTKLAELWLARKRSFRVVSASQLANNTTMAGYKVGADVPPLSAGAEGLIGGYFVGNAAPFFILWTIILRRSGRLLRDAFRWRAIWAAAKRYWRFPLFSTPATLVASLELRAAFFFVPVFFVVQKQEILGLYTFAFTNVSIPLAYFARAVAQVFFVSAVEAQLQGNLHVVAEGVHRRLVMVMLFPTLVILVAGPDLFAIVFSETWREAGIYAQYVAPWIFLASVCSPLSRIYDVLQRQRLDFVMGFVSLVLVIAALLLGGRTGDVRTYLLFLCVGGCLARLLRLAVVSYLAHVPAFKVVAPYFRYLAYAAPGLLLMLGIRALGDPLLTVAGSLAATGIYGVLLLWKEKLIRWPL